MALGKRDFKTAFKCDNAATNIKQNSKRIASCNLVETEKSKIKVFIRIRPFNEKEMMNGCSKILNVLDKNCLIFDPKVSNEPFCYKGFVQKGRDITKKVNKDLLFEFDQVFDENVSNEKIYEATTENMIKSLFEGYNCSVFAYGATGAGKTYTMLGTESSPGITYLTIVELLKQLAVLQQNSVKCTIGVSYLEVYNENIKDLLHPSSPQLQLREENGRVIVTGLKVEQIDSSHQLFTLLDEGNKNRSQHPTDSNAESSRSHAVFQVHVQMENNGELKLAKLSMIDLAGSERGAATGCKGARFKEGTNINKSLLALGNCINALADGLKHVPYRDSKLTRILKDCLGGNCLTMMVANISPSSLAFEDTYNTLKYASRAKCIKTKASKNVVSESHSVAYYKKLVEQLQEKLNKFESNGGLVDMKELDHRIVAAMEQKKSIHKRMLILQSQEKLTEWRLLHKSVAQALYDPNTDLQSLNRLNSCIKQLKARAEVIRKRIEELKPQQHANNTLVDNLLSEIRGQNPKLSLAIYKMELFEQQITIDEQESCIDHMSSIIKLQAKQEETHKSAINTVMPFLNECYSLLRGYGHVTTALESKYQEAMRSLDGLKSVTWCDEDEDNQPNNNQLLRLSLSMVHSRSPPEVALPTASAAILPPPLPVPAAETSRPTLTRPPVVAGSAGATPYSNATGPTAKRIKVEFNPTYTPLTAKSKTFIKARPNKHVISTTSRSRAKIAAAKSGKNEATTLRRTPLSTSLYQNAITNRQSFMKFNKVSMK